MGVSRDAARLLLIRGQHQHPARARHLPEIQQGGQHDPDHPAYVTAAVQIPVPINGLSIFRGVAEGASSISCGHPRATAYPLAPSGHSGLVTAGRGDLPVPAAFPTLRCMGKAAHHKKNARPRAPRSWARLPKDKLLDLRICDLGLKIKGSPLEPRIEQLYAELDKRGLELRPHFWLSDEWYVPHGVPGVAIPFFLAHPRLRRLEQEFMLELEGGSRDWCMRLLRHEAAHALLNAYKLHERRDWKKTFGRPSTPYPRTYLPKPYSKRFVLNLPNWYAQAHPDEDWAETFAVWLRPRFDWRRRYRGWPALKKLQYVDSLMDEIRHRRPRLRNTRTVLPVEKMHLTLRKYYDDKLARYGSDSPEFFDRDLKRLFSSEPEHTRHEKASRYIRRVRKEVIDIVERWTSEYKYRINEVIKDMISRCDALGLRVAGDESDLKLEIVAFLAVVVMNKLHSGGYRISL